MYDLNNCTETINNKNMIQNLKMKENVFNITNFVNTSIKLNQKQSDLFNKNIYLPYN